MMTYDDLRFLSDDCVKQNARREMELCSYLRFDRRGNRKLNCLMAFFCRRDWRQKKRKGLKNVLL